MLGLRARRWSFLQRRNLAVSVGGQILISQETLNEIWPLVKIADRMEVEPKGVKEPITIYEVAGWVVSTTYSCQSSKRISRR